MKEEFLWYSIIFKSYALIKYFDVWDSKNLVYHQNINRNNLC